MDLTRFACFLLVCISTTSGYHTYTVERDCSSGNMTVLLTASGPSSASLLRTTDRTSYSMSGDCRIEVKAPTDHHRIVASIREIGFRFRSRLPGTCEDFIRIEERSMCSHLYRIEEQHHFTSKGDTLEILHHVSYTGLNNSTLTGYPGVKLTLTALTTGGECSSAKDWFRCRNGFCIWSDLRCDSHNNCGDRSDEEECGVPGGGPTTSLIILAVLIVLLLLIMCIATLLCSKNETVRRFSHRLRSRTISYMPRFSK